MLETYVFSPMVGPLFVREINREPYRETSVHRCSILRSQTRCPVCGGSGEGRPGLFGGKRTCPLCKGSGYARI